MAVTADEGASSRFAAGSTADVAASGVTSELLRDADREGAGEGSAFGDESTALGFLSLVAPCAGA